MVNCKKLKKGSTLIISPVIILFSFLIIMILGSFFINAIKPFIWYEKLNNISNKYMFVIEKFGYLTYEEKNNLEKELEKSGFNIENINIQYPINPKTYGELLVFEIKYKLELKFPGFSKSENRNIDIVIKKHSFSKV